MRNNFSFCHTQMFNGQKQIFEIKVKTAVKALKENFFLEVLIIMVKLFFLNFLERLKLLSKELKIDFKVQTNFVPREKASDGNF